MDTRSDRRLSDDAPLAEDFEAHENVLGCLGVGKHLLLIPL